MGGGGLGARTEGGASGEDAAKPQALLHIHDEGGAQGVAGGLLQTRRGTTGPLDDRVIVVVSVVAVRHDCLVG
jgi:hypothetical protein